MHDTYKHKGRRQRMVDALMRRGIVDPYVLAAMNRVPRHLFMESFMDELAYTDKALPIGAGQTISQPYTVAFQTQLLELKRGEKVLEIGTGSGYQTAVLAECKAKVFSIERQRELFVRTREVLAQLGVKAYLHYGDGFAGLPTFGPFDRVLVTAGAAEVPVALLGQLKIGGWMVAPIGAGALQTMTRISRTGENEFNTQHFGTFSFVPMLKGTENK